MVTLVRVVASATTPTVEMAVLALAEDGGVSLRVKAVSALETETSLLEVEAQVWGVRYLSAKEL